MVFLSCFEAAELTGQVVANQTLRGSDLSSLKGSRFAAGQELCGQVRPFGSEMKASDIVRQVACGRQQVPTRNDQKCVSLDFSQGHFRGTSSSCHTAPITGRFRVRAKASIELPCPPSPAAMRQIREWSEEVMRKQLEAGNAWATACVPLPS